MIKKKIAKLAIALTLVTSFVMGPVTSSYTVVEAKSTQVSQEKINELQSKANELRAAVRENRIKAKACEMLLNDFPQLVKSVRGDLEKLVKRSEKTRQDSQKLLDYIENYLKEIK